MFGSILDGVRSLCGRDMYRKIGTISADKGYDTKSNRKTLVKRGFADGIMYRSNSKIHNISKVNRKRGKSRYVVERTYAWFKAFRRIGVRYERKEENYLAFVTIASTIIHWRVMG